MTPAKKGVGPGQRSRRAVMGAGRPARPLHLVVVAGIALTGVALGIWLVVKTLPHWLTTNHAVTAGDTASTPGSESRRIRATLFYVADDGNALVAVDREVPYGSTPADQAREIVQVQVAAAPPGLTSPIPAGTVVRHLFLTAHGEAFVDLSHEVVSNHTGGSLDEALTVFAVVNALTVNLPGITSVQILVEGQQVDTLVGHVDLRHPLRKSPQWIRKDNKTP